MESALYVGAHRMQGLTEDLQVVASNMANANTSGYKRTVGTFEAVLNAATLDALGRSGGVGATAHWPDFQGSRVDFSQGPVRRTGRELDVALDGDGFLVVDTPGGQRYTRKGRLHMSPTGELTDGAGHTFVSDSGALKLPAGAAEIVIDRSGQISADGTVVGKLQIFDVPDKTGLVAEGGATYRNTGRTGQAAAETSVVQGALEESNVNTVTEMVTLVSVMRAYEAVSRLMKRMESLQGKLSDASG